jgi:hypothetical protein
MPKLNSVLLVTICLCLLVPAACRKSEVKGKPADTIEEAPSLLPMVQVADPKASAQLVKGFHNVEGNSWRWTMGRFSAVLSPPPGASKNGANLVLRFSIPEAVIHKVGPMSLSAVVDGTPLEPQTYSSAGQQVFSRAVPQSAVAKNVVAVDFSLDKYLPPSEADRRELGVVVSVIGFEPK